MRIGSGFFADRSSWAESSDRDAAVPKKRTSKNDLSSVAQISADQIRVNLHKSAQSLFNLVNTVPATEAAEDVLHSEFHGLTQETALGQRPYQISKEPHSSINLCKSVQLFRENPRLLFCFCLASRQAARSTDSAA